MLSHALVKECLLKCNEWKTFLLLTGITVLITFVFNYLLISDELYYQYFGVELATDRIAKIIKLSRDLQWVGYILTSVIILIRVSFAALCIYIGCFLCNLNVRYKELFKIALWSDFVFVLAALTKLGILTFFKQVNTLEDLQFQPLSLLELFDRSKVEAYLLYPLSLISVFELLYWIVLAWLLSSLINRSFVSSLKTIAVSYGLGLLLWVLFVMFITINLS